MAFLRARARPDTRVRSADRVVPWLVRGLWVALPFTAGPALAEALDGFSVAVRTVAAVGLWLGWAGGMVASFVPLPVSLTALRVAAPAALVAVAAAAAAGHGSALAAGWAALVLAWVLAPALGEWCVNGPAYPNERRYPLRAPGALLAGPLALAWGLALAGICAGPLLLAAGNWLFGPTAVVFGVPLSVLLLRGLHNLSRRWAVFVPAGMVLHDPLTLVDPVLFRRQTVAAIRPATVDTPALDLTQKAPGLALELQLTEPVSLSLMKPGRREGQPVSSDRLLFTPTRPGVVVEAARARRFRLS